MSLVAGGGCDAAREDWSASDGRAVRPLLAAALLGLMLAATGAASIKVNARFGAYEQAVVVASGGEWAVLWLRDRHG